MASPFLVRFTEVVLGRLVTDGQLEIASGRHDAVVVFVAARLGAARQGDSLVSTFVAAVLASPDVDELFADNDTIKQLITDLPLDALPRGVP